MAKSNKSFGSRLFGFFILFTVTSAITTAVLIYRDINKEVKEDIVEEIVEEEIIKTDVVSATKLTDLYNQNDLIIKEKLYLNNEKVKYLEIEGLINKLIENNINQKIKNTVKELYIEDDEEDYTDLQIDVYVTANFSNVLSMVLNKYVAINEDKIDNYEGKDFYEYIDYYTGERQYSYNESKNLNFRLDTGEEIEFEDLFIDTANIKEVMSKSLYKTFVRRYSYSSAEDAYTNAGIDMNRIDYSNIENEVTEALNYYRKNGVKEFNVNHNNVSIYYKDMTVFISLSDFYNQIGIYNRFKTKDSLYEKDNIGFKDCLVFTYRGNGTYNSSSAYYNCDYSIFKKVTDNLFVDCILTINTQTEEDKEELIKELSEKINNKIEEIRKISNKSKEKTYVYSIMCTANEYNDFELDIVIQNLYEMSKEYFNENGMLLISKWYTMTGMEMATIRFNYFNEFENVNIKEIELEEQRENIEEITEGENVEEENTENQSNIELFM